MGRPRRAKLLRLLALSAPWVLGACGTLLGLGDLEKVDCVASCGGSSSGAASVAGNVGVAGSLATSGTSSVYVPGGSSSTLPTGGVAGSVAGSLASGGDLPGLGGAPDTGGAGGESPQPINQVCPGGPEPALTWQEHWFEHNQLLSRVYYDDCIVLYFDADMPPATQDWMAPFLVKAWTYSLTSYGKLGSERLYAVAHQGKYFGGHSSTYLEASHDNHSVIDMGANSWVDGDYDLPAHLLGFLVDDQGSHTKVGSPKFEHYGNEGFPLIYKYDLYLGLGLTSAADQALAQFDTVSNSNPYPNTFWFRDWFYPLWRDHGHAQVFANYMTLLQKYYPVANDGFMPTMNYGQYFHFMSGAAGVDLVPLWKGANTWYPGFTDEVTAAKQDFPDIKY